MPDTAIPALDESADHMGVCENIVPMVFIINGGPVTLQPTIHGSRRCAEWTPDWPGDEDDNGGGEPAPDPAINRVRQIFPIRPVPTAA
ncbi:hypothetical protein HHL26_06570 [Sphingobium sp. TB-6]|uniref:hypothetical protein n=1 Tax=Sphingobium sp. TB-6 TaxID=2728850 RepID=UPI001469EAB8|nr:hypothetical protein [Sphingobium sp. TB-6]NML88730.1 hypothetical protein [Sphingobium sp. TB-6]